MRKGRSSRRSRVSRPLIGVKAPPLSADALAPDLSSNPRVIVGVPPSDPPPSGSSGSTPPPSVETKGSVDGVVPSLSARSIVDPLDALEKLEKASVPPPAKVADEPAAASDDQDDDEGTKTLGSLGSTIAFGSTSDGDAMSTKTEDAPPADTKRSLASTVAFGSNAEVKVAEPPPAAAAADDSDGEEEDDDEAEAKEPSSAQAVTADAAKSIEPAKVVEATQPSPPPVVEKVETKEPEASEPAVAKVAPVEAEPAPPSRKKNKKKNKAADLERARAEAAAAADATHPDEISVPPIGDISVDEQFFSEGDHSRSLDADVLEGDALTIPDKARRKAEPHVVQRRERFVRYVKWAVAGAAIVCVAAVARTSLTAKAPGSAAANAVVATATPESAPAAPKAAVQAAAPITTPAAAPSAKATEEPAAAAPAETAAAAPEPDTKTGTTEATPEPTEATPEPTEPTEPIAEAVTGDAKEEKAKARTSLEKRKISDAIEAGERSVKLDPTDGEAWLILGAAYQEKGNMVEARRAYASCVKEGKTGPRQECAKMLR